MSQPDPSVVLPILDTLEAELARIPESALTRNVRHQCDRLRQAARFSHAEGVRFAGFTVTRLMQQPGTNLGPEIRAAAARLAEVLGLSDAH